MIRAVDGRLRVVAHDGQRVSHVGRAAPNFYRAEHDPLATEVLVAQGYDRKDGTSSVPAAPGFGLSIEERKFATEVKVRFDLK